MKKADVTAELNDPIAQKLLRSGALALAYTVVVPASVAFGVLVGVLLRIVPRSAVGGSQEPVRGLV